MTVKYALAESIFTVAGSAEFVRDKFADDGTPTEGVLKPGSMTATVAAGLRADPLAEREIDLTGIGSDDDFTVAKTADGRLTGVSYKSVGIGGRVVEAAASIIAFVGGIAGAISGGVTAMVEGSTTCPPDDAGAAKEIAAENRAKACWKQLHPTEDKLLSGYVTLITSISESLATVRSEAATEGDARKQSRTVARAKRLELLRADAQSEVERLTAGYKAWRSQTITTRTVTKSFDLGVKDLPVGLGTVPDLAALSPAARAVWDELGVIVQIAPGVAAPGESGPPYATGNPRIDQYVEDAKQAENRRLVWRLPRAIRVWIWRRGPGDAVDLERTFPAMVVDAGSSVGDLTVDRGLFGDHAATVDFGDYGVASKVVTTEKGALGMFADAIAKVPGQITTGLESAQKAQVAASSLLDAKEQRSLDAVKRRVETLTKELEEKGLAATQGDYVRLKELEQQVAIQTAETSLEPKADLTLLKEKLELLQTEASIREAQIQAQLAEMYALMATPTNPRRVRPKPE